jgi:hypothetical protein
MIIQEVIMSIEYWDYFLAIENDFGKCSRYVEFCEDNKKSYLIEFAKIIMSAASEIDTISKIFCSNVNPRAKADNIRDYGDIIVNKYPNIKNVEVRTNNNSLIGKPWESWDNTTIPEWWRKYNSIKHDRTISFLEANLGNAFLSVSGLLVLLLFYYYEKNGEWQEIDIFKAPKYLNIYSSAMAGIENSGMLWGYIMP